MFYVSTTSSISTVSTASFCLVPSATDTAIATCAKKKKRALNILKAAPVQSSARIDPSSAVVAEDPLQLDSSSLDLNNAEIKNR